MTNRRALLGSAAAVLAQVLLRQAKAANKVVFQHDLPDVNLHDWAVTAVEVNYPPGGSSTAHRHPGITIVYVLEGEVRSKVGDGPEKIPYGQNTHSALARWGYGPAALPLDTAGAALNS